MPVIVRNMGRGAGVAASTELRHQLGSPRRDREPPRGGSILEYNVGLL